MLRGYAGKTTLRFFASIFMKTIPLKTKYCPKRSEFILFRNRRIKIAKTCSVLIFAPFLSRKRGLKTIFIKKKMKQKNLGNFAKS